jgi:hypothetical protein
MAVVAAVQQVAEQVVAGLMMMMHFQAFFLVL